MEKFILTTTLNPAVDKTVYVSGFKIGYDFREIDSRIDAGGKGINVSKVLRLLRVPAMATGFTGGPDGYFIKQELTGKKINFNFVTIKGNSRTSTTYIDTESNRITRVIGKGPTVTDRELTAFSNKYQRLLKHSAYTVLSGRNISGAPEDYYAWLVQKSRRNNIPVILDTSGKSFFNAVKKNPWMIKPNIEEAQELLQDRLDSIRKMKSALECFYNLGVKIIALTLAGRGSIVYNGRDFYQITVPRVKSRSPVGCGDSFIAGFLSAVYKKKTLIDAITTASACGTANAMTIGPGVIKPGCIKDIKQHIKIKMI